MGHPELRRFPDAAALAAAVADDWIALASAAPADRPQLFAVSGGRIAGDLFAAVAARGQGGVPGFTSAHWFWADERCVPPDKSDSNYLLARTRLFAPLGLSGDRIHRIRGELDPATAAAEAGADLRRLAPSDALGRPVLDLVLLGMGEDGHVASIFPEEPVEVTASPEIYRAVVATKPPPRRVTIGHGVLCAARQVWVLVSGAGKEAALRESLAPDGATPLARLLRDRPATWVCVVAAILPPAPASPPTPG